MITPNRRFQFELRTLLVATAFIAALVWAFLATQQAEKFRAEAERLQLERDWQSTKVRTQDQLILTVREATQRQPDPVRVPKSVPDHWLTPPDAQALESQRASWPLPPAGKNVNN